MQSSRAIHEHGGDVLKLIGDGTLVIFTAKDHTHACGAAVCAYDDAHGRHTALRRGHLAWLQAAAKTSAAERERCAVIVERWNAAGHRPSAPR
jgi:class 3 adenylate cyclase